MEYCIEPSIWCHGRLFHVPTRTTSSEAIGDVEQTSAMGVADSLALYAVDCYQEL